MKTSIIRQAEECVALLTCICFYNCKISGLQSSEAEMFRCAYWQIAKFRWNVAPSFLGRNSSRLWRLRKWDQSKRRQVFTEEHMKYPSRLGPSVLLQLQSSDGVVKKWH